MGRSRIANRSCAHASRPVRPACSCAGLMVTLGTAVLLNGHLLPCVIPTGKVGSKFPVIITSYEIVMADVKFLQKYHFKYIVVDEGHRLKNMNCKLLRELRTIRTENKLLLSGGLCFVRRATQSAGINEARDTVPQ